MRPPESRRQLALFLAALFVPCALLIALGVRVTAQEEELAERRWADSRQTLARTVGQELRASLLEIATIDRDAMRSGALAHPATVAVLASDNGAMVPAWRRDAVAQAFAAAIRTPRIARELRMGQQAELVQGNQRAAGEAYRRAARMTDNPAVAAYVRLLATRSQPGGAPAAIASYRRLATLDAGVRDDDGVPIALHALTHLVPLSAQPASVRLAFDRLATSLARAPWLSPTACHAAAAIGDTSAIPVARCAELERIEGVAGERLPKVGTWRVIHSPDAPWLVFATTAGPGDTVAVVTRMSAALAGASLKVASAAADTAASNPIPGGEGLWLTPADRPSSATPTRRLYLVSVLFAIVVGLAGALLLLRDVRREAATARMREQFVAGVSHELKTPLTSIRMFAETLRDRPLPEEQRTEYLDTVVGETHRLTRLLNNVLEFSRIDRGERTYAFASIDVRVVVDAALRAMRHPLEQLGFTVLVQRDDASLVVHGDADAIEQAILNLLGNAVKYSGRQRDLRVTVRRRGPEAIVAVTDFGVGIPLAEQERIFEKFYRARSETNASVTGTGLGLTLVKHIAEAHGGSIRVKSVEGRGSTFELAIPLGGTRVRSPAFGAAPDLAVAR